jgi:PAS domain S-box-containing protein
MISAMADHDPVGSAERGAEQVLELQRIVNLTPQQIAIMEADGRISWLNDYALDYFGISLADLSVLDMRAYAIHPDDLPALRDQRRKELAAGVPFGGEVRMRGRDGIYRRFLARYTPLKDAEGRVVRWYGAATEIEDRKRAEEALRRSESYLAEAQRLTHTGSWAVDYRTRDVLYWSEETFRIYGVDPQRGLPTRQDFQRLVHPEDLSRLSTVVDEAFRANADFTVDGRIVLDGGASRHVQIIGHPAFARNGDPIEYIGTVVDVTERKKIEEERERLRRLEADLAHLNRVSTLGELAASVAHDLKQPTTAAIVDAKTCLRWLSRDHPDLDEAREAASRAIKDSTRAVEIIDRLRSLYKKEPPKRELVDVNDVARNMLALLRSEANRHSISMRADLAEARSRIMADRVQLQQVFMNLVLNAIEAMTETGGELVLKSELSNDGQLLVSISDTGVGIPIDKNDEIFDAFVTTKPQGTGMGLAITRSIIEAHDGRLWVTRNSGPGATFHFTLPLLATAAGAVSANGALS